MKHHVLISLLLLPTLVITRASDLSDLIDPDTKATKLADGFGFGEGPVWHPGEQALYFSDLKNKTMHRWSESEGITLVRQGKETFSNGIVVDAQGRLVFCETGDCRIVRREKDGTETVLADKVNGKPMGITNDLWRAPDGGIYFTVPNKKLRKFKDEDRIIGAIVYLTPDGKTRNVGKAVHVKAPNGIVGSSDGKRLYYRDGGTCKMAQILPDGTLTEPKLIADRGPTD